MWKTTQPTASAVKVGNAVYCHNRLFGLRNFILLFFLIAISSLQAQRNLTLYNLSAVPQSFSLNPGRMPLSNVYVSLPVIGNINANYSNSGFNFGDLMLGGDDDENFFDSDFTDFLGILDDENRLNLDINLSWLEFGFRVKKNFFSFQAGDYVQFQTDYPRDLFSLLNDVSQDTTNFQEERIYDFAGLGMHGTHFRSYGLGYTRVITPQLSAGVRFKILSGMANVSTLNQDLRLVNDLDNDYLAIEGRFDVFSSGLQTLSDDPATYLRGSGNHGFALDLGANYQVNDQIEVFASVMNLGRIHWKNDLTYNAIVNGSVQFPTDDIDEFEEELEEFLDSLQMPTNFPLGAYATRLPAMAYFGGNYFFRPNTSVGVLFNPRFYEGNTDWAFSLGLQHRVGKFLQAAINYSTYNKSAFNLGAGLALNAGPLQIYFASDNFLPIFNLEKAKNAQFNAGINLAFGRMTREEQLALWQDSTGVAEDFPMEKPIVVEDAEPSEKTVKPEKQSKTKQAKVEETAKPVAETAPAAEELKPYLSFIGAARNAENGAALPGITIEVYRSLPGGGEELALINSFLDGNIKVTLQRSKDYRIIVKKPGFADREIRVNAADMAGENELRKDVVLSIDASQEQAEKPKEVISTPEPTPPIRPENPVKPEHPETKVKTYKVLDISSLQLEPNASARSLFRLQKGNRVQVLEKTNATWWKVQYIARIGYVRANMLEKVE
ncbi:MAG: hypothetical protein IPJ74_23885 [Saprospiraceae bacterium]|nr:hypothetical protein [Saprospiraceae bacterium]